MKTNTKTKINLRTWLSIIIFGLVGQIAWIVENMYFAKFAQDIFISDNNAAYLSTTLMVILSAIMAIFFYLLEPDLYCIDELQFFKVYFPISTVRLFIK